MPKVIGTAHVPPTVTTEPLAPLGIRVATRQCPPWCIEHAEVPAELRAFDPSVTHYGRKYLAPVVFDGDVTTFEMCLYRFDEDQAAGKVGDPIVYTNFDGHGVDMTIEQARAMHRSLGAMVTVVERESELVEFADRLADLSQALKGATPTDREEFGARLAGAESIPRPEPRQPIAGLPACPAWCRGDCTGGEEEHLGNGETITADRVHALTLADMTVVNGDSYRGTRTVDARLLVERYDTTDPSEEPIRTRVLLDIDKVQRLAPTSAQLRTLAAAALEAADLLDAALAAEGR